MEDLGKRLKSLREQKGMSLRELAKAAHVSPSFIADIESGRSRPSLETLESLARALGVSPSELVDPSTPSWWYRDTPPTDVELEEFLKSANVHFNGAPLTEEDKEDIVAYLRFRWEREKKKREKESGK